MENDQNQRPGVMPFIRKKRQMKNPILVDLLRYWERLRAGRIAPLRSEINPREIENALEHAFILEHVAHNNVRFRIAGMELCDLMGMEVRGMAANSVIIPESRDTFDAMLTGLFENPEIIEIELTAQRQLLPPLKADMLLLPMKSDLGVISRVLGALVVNGPKGPPPHRFAMHAVKVTRIIAAETGPHRDLLPGFAEPAAKFVSRPTMSPATPPVSSGSKTTAPYLRLVKSDD